jgi:uncharacterized protein YabE (DUF348 family)
MSRGRVRRGLVLLLVAALSVPLVLAPDRIAIAVDGEVVRVRSYAGTVDEALTAAGVEVGPDDRVEPGLAVPVDDGLGIEVVRAVPVVLEVDGRRAVLPVAGETVADVLVAAGIGDVRGLSVTPAPSTPLSRTRTVEVVQPVTARIVVDGGVHRVRMRGGTVADALALAGIEVRDRDRVRPPGRTVLHEDTTRVVVIRRDTRRVVKEVTLPFDEQVEETDDLYEGEQEVVREGREGLRRDTYRIRLVDGERVSRDLVEREVVTEPVDRVVHVGTAARPAPEPPPPPPAPEPEPPPAEDLSVWDRLAGCESGGNWHLDGAYDGGLQFHPDTWNRWKPSGYPAYAHQASRLQQIEVGRRLHAVSGWSPWPHCSRVLGLR